jgi:CRISPR/Cas system-associated exonuclease Cas4 (RecB family)|tara:strand:+ start:640 stop:2118 length:1479 start_codon:yes stop_codon:yes gene_type:complete
VDKIPLRLLSKSKYLTGLQCPRLIWIQFHEPAKIPEADPVTQYIFDQGHMVGELAQKLFPDAIVIPTDNFMGNIKQTSQLLEQRRPLCEAGILAKNLYSRIDILNPVNKNEWDIVEVKSSTSVKDIHISDVAYQRYCCSQAGLNIRKCFLTLINNQYVKEGQINPEGLFNLHDVTDQVEETSVGIQDRIDEILEVISREECPEMIIGPHCRDPYECPLADCWDFLPEHSVFSLYYGGKKSFTMYDGGILTVREIPDDYKLNDKQRIQQTCVTSGEPHVDKQAIQDFLSSLQYPLYYLDFETIGPVVPLFDGVRPYQNIPFQFSVHVVKDEQSPPVHHSYLVSDTNDPRPALLAELQKVLGNSGSIIVYNKGFEDGILRDLAGAFPAYNDWINQVCSRLVDLLVPFRNFDYYHPAQKGSASLKAVLPAITGRGYEDLDISDGQLASITFLRSTYGDMPEEDREKVMRDLEEYCSRDTEGMIWIVERLGQNAQL